MLGEVSAAHLISFQTSKLAEGYQPSSINRMTVLLKFMINCAMRWEYIPRKVGWASDVSELRNVRSRERFLRSDEARRLLHALDRYQEPIAAMLVRLLLLTGARKSELLLAKWSQIDWRFQTLMVPLSKSGSTRYIYLSNAVISLFSDLKSVTGDTYIFSYPGMDCPLSNFNRHWMHIRADADLQDFRLHDLRHSFASFLIAEGRSLFEVQKLLGHSNAATTMKYAHLANHQMIAAASVVLPAISRVDGLG